MTKYKKVSSGRKRSSLNKILLLLILKLDAFRFAENQNQKFRTKLMVLMIFGRKTQIWKFRTFTHISGVSHTDSGVSFAPRLIMMTSLMTSQNKCNLLGYLYVFFVFLRSRFIFYQDIFIKMIIIHN